MCLHPVQIINPTKYVSLKFRDRFLLSIPCGHCAECQQALSNQWFLRSWQECCDLNARSGILYFDTLTYEDSHLPHMSDIIPDLPHVSCFRPIDVRNFVESLRLRLKRKYNTTFRYFVSSEYGSKKYTMRPHYHILLFVYGSISPDQLSIEISNLWKHGRTDGIPYRSTSYVTSHNVVNADSLPANYLRACSYVTKYVQKSAVYQKDLDKRLNNAMNIISSKMPDNWIKSVNALRVRTKLKRHINQFHHQSQHFGESLLQQIDLNSLFENGCLFMPSPKGLKIPVPIPTYYKRKLFYDLYEIDGTKSWQLNDLGVQFREHRKLKLVENLANTFYAASLTYHLLLSQFQCRALADYVFNYQGRINAEVESNNLLEKLPSVTLYNYVTMSDKEHLSKLGISTIYLGNNSIGYIDNMMQLVSFKNFIANHVIIDPNKEKQLNLIYYHLSHLNEKKQESFELRQRLESLYKDLRETSAG